jgi:hypothetical protein
MYFSGICKESKEINCATSEELTPMPSVVRSAWTRGSCCRLLASLLSGVYRQLYRHCGELLQSMASIDHAAWTRTRAADSWCRCCPVCTDSSTDTVANLSSPWLRLITLFGLGLVLRRLLVSLLSSVHRQLY